jgi:hypothetical protein
VAAPHLAAELVLGREMLRVAEALVQGQLRLTALGDGRLVRLHRAVPPRQKRPDVLGGRGRRERPLEPAARRRGGHARVRRRALVARRRERARQVERELGLLRRRGDRVTRAVSYGRGFLHPRRLRSRRRLAAAETHGPRRVGNRRISPRNSGNPAQEPDERPVTDSPRTRLHLPD